MPIKRIPPAVGAQLPEQLWVTPIGGLARRYLNASGVTLLKGRIVRFSTSTSNAVDLTGTSDVNPIGVVWEDIPNGQQGWIVYAGTVDFYTSNTGTTNRGDWVGASQTVAGQADTGPTPPSTTEHWREIGHTCDTRSGAGLVRGVIHCN